MIWTHGENQLQEFLHNLNRFHTSIKFTWNTSISESRVEFLDVSLAVEDKRLEYELYTKPTDCHQYLHYKSCHPNHIKRSIIYSQALRVSKRYCNLEKSKTKLREMENWFLNRCYPRKLVKEQMVKANTHINTNHYSVAQTDKNERSEIGIPLVLTFHPAMSIMGKYIRRNLTALYQTKKLKEVFTPSPFVSFRNCKTVKDKLVRAKLPPTNDKKGTFHCKHGACLVCNNIKETNTFESAVTGTQYAVNFNFNCNSKAVIYLITCRVCKIQYVGESTTKFRARWNNYKTNQRRAALGKEHTQPEFHAHFLQEDHSGLETDADVVLIDKTDPTRPKEREKHWIDTLNTWTPNGLNVNEDI